MGTKKVQVIERSSYRELRTNDLKEGKTMMLCTSIHTMYILIAIWLVPGVGKIFPSEIIKNVSSLSGNLLNDLRHYVKKKSFSTWNLFLQLGLPLFLLLSAHEKLYSLSRILPWLQQFGSFTCLLFCCRKKIKMLFTSLGWSVLEKLCPLSWVPKCLEYPTPRAQFFPIRNLQAGG